MAPGGEEGAVRGRQSGTAVKPDKPNAVKLEQFVFDAVPLARNAMVVHDRPVRGVQPGQERRWHATARPRSQAGPGATSGPLAGVGGRVSVPMNGDEPAATVEISPLVRRHAGAAEGASRCRPIQAGEERLPRLKLRFQSVGRPSHLRADPARGRPVEAFASAGPRNKLLEPLRRQMPTIARAVAPFLARADCVSRARPLLGRARVDRRVAGRFGRIACCPGGATRAHSVLEALAAGAGRRWSGSPSTTPPGR